MTTLYVRSTDGNNADTGLTWALAKATLSGAAGIDVAGDTVYVSQVHAETQAVNANPNWATTTNNPVKVICANDGAEPPTAVATTATATTTSTGSWAIDGSHYCYGIKFLCSSGASAAAIIFGNATDGQYMEYEKCQFTIVGTATTSVIRVGGVSRTAARCFWTDCDVKFNNASQGITFTNYDFRWRGGSVIAGGSTPTTLITSYQTNLGFTGLIENVDFSNFSAAFSLSIGPEAGQIMVIRNCSLPVGWLGTLTTSQAEGRISMYNCSSGEQNYKLWIEDFGGVIRDDTFFTRFGGANDGERNIAWYMISNTNVSTWGTQLKTDEIVRKFPGSDAERYAWTPGASKTVSVEILHDSATPLTDSEVWLEVNYVSELGSPQYIGGIFVSDKTANILTAAADQTASSSVWYDSSPSLANPNKQTLSVTVSPRNKGFIIARVVLAKTSKTVWVDPKITVS